MNMNSIQVSTEQLARWRDNLDHLNFLSRTIDPLALTYINRVQNEIRTVLEDSSDRKAQ